MQRQVLLVLISFIFVILLCGASSAAVNGTANETQNSSVCAADPIINGTVTINEYGHIRPLANATVTVNSTANNSRVLGMATTDANGYYSISFYSTDNQFRVTTSYTGCNSIIQLVNVSRSADPNDPNYYGTSNFQLTPLSATLTGTGNGRNVYIQGQNKNGFAGVINVRVGNNEYQAYCIDLFTPISVGDTLLINGPLPGTAGDLPSQVDWGKVIYILNNYNPSDNNSEAAAIQCAIWYFTSVHYGPYGGPNPVPGYYQYMTAPLDGTYTTIFGSRVYDVQNRALEIIRAAISVQYPSSITLTPETTKIPNGQSTTLTATVRDRNGNPMQGVTVNFQTDKGTLNYYSGTTNANGQFTVTLSNIPNGNSAVVTAYVTGNYGNLLYDNQYATPRKQNLAVRNLLPLTLSDISIVNSDTTANVALSQSSSSPVNVGDTVTYTVTARNNGQYTATGIMINDIVPPGLTGVTVTPSVGTYYNGVWVIPTLANGATATLTITGTATSAMAGLNTTNTATRTAQNEYNSQPAVSTATVYTKKADVALSQTVNGANSGSLNVNVGDNLTFIITARNNGPDTATNINIRDIIPTGLTNVNVNPSVGTYNSGTGIWTIPSLANGATATLTITAKAGANMAGLNTTNTATWISQTEYDPTAPTTTSIPIYTKKADVSISQTANSPVNVGDVVNYVVTLFNNGPDAATNLNIQDIIPAGLTDVVVTASMGVYNNGLWVINTLASGATATLTIAGKAGVAMAGLLTTNTATRTSQTEYNSRPAVAAADVYTKKSVLTITNNANSSNLNVGQTGTFTVTVTNSGPDAATNIKINDLIPNGFTAGTPTAGNYNGSVWTINSLASGSNATLTFTGLITSSMAGLNITTGGNATWNEYPQALNLTNATIHVNKAVVSVTNTPSIATPNVGQQFYYTITVTNNGDDTATGVRVAGNLPAGLTLNNYSASQGTLDYNGWNVGTLTKGSTATLILYVTPQSSIAGQNITVTTTETQNEYPQTASASSTIHVKQAQVVITNTANSSSLNVGDTAVFTVNVTNNGPDAATNVKINAPLPAGFTADTHGVGTYSGGIWTIDSLSGGSTATLTFTGVLQNATAGTNITNHVTETQDEYPFTVSVEDVTIYVKKADVALSQTGSYSGNKVTFIVTATNNGPDTATNINIRDLIPTGLTGVVVTHSVGTYDSVTGIWSIGSLLNGTFATLNITGNATPQTTVNNTATKLNQTEYDPNTPDTTVFSVYVPEVDISLFNHSWNYVAATDSYKDSYVYGNTPLFMMDIVNNGPDDATGIVIEYIIPEGFEYIAYSTRGIGTAIYTYDSVNKRGIVTFYIDSLPRGGSAVLNVFTRIIQTGNKTSNLTTTGTLTHVDQYDSNSTNNQSAFGLYVPPSADIQLNQTYTTFIGSDGKKYVTFTITVTNNGPDNATGVKITDKLPSGLIYKEHSINGVKNDPAYIPSSGVWTIGNFNVTDQPKTIEITAEIISTDVIRNYARKTAETQNDWDATNNGQTIDLVN
ncbi:MAG: Ig-like domain-containing protein [Methanobacterium sp.]